MRSLAELEEAIHAVSPRPDGRAAAEALLAFGEEVLEHWIVARDEAPTRDTREGFRLLALHRQGTKGDPSFNACRETCRELVYYFNLVTGDLDHPKTGDRLEMMRMICGHLFLFVSGKLEVAGLGDFCCSSRPLRERAEHDFEVAKEA